MLVMNRSIMYRIIEQVDSLDPYKRVLFLDRMPGSGKGIRCNCRFLWVVWYIRFRSTESRR